MLSRSVARAGRKLNLKENPVNMNATNPRQAYCINWWSVITPSFLPIWRCKAKNYLCTFKKNLKPTLNADG